MSEQLYTREQMLEAMKYASSHLSSLSGIHKYLEKVFPAQDEPPHVTLEQIMDEYAKSLHYENWEALHNQFCDLNNTKTLVGFFRQIAERYAASQLPSPLNAQEVYVKVDVKDELPKKGEHVFVLMDVPMKEKNVSHIMKHNSKWWDYDGRITHWLKAIPVSSIPAGNPNHIGEARRFKMAGDNPECVVVNFGNEYAATLPDHESAVDTCETLNDILSRLSPSGTVPLKDITDLVSDFDLMRKDFDTWYGNSADRLKTSDGSDRAYYNGWISCLDSVNDQIRNLDVLRMKPFRKAAESLITTNKN